MVRLKCVCAIAFLFILSASSAQTAQDVWDKVTGKPATPPPYIVPPPVTPATPAPAHHAKSAPKPEPTPQELVEYIRGKLLTLSASDSINDYLDVTFDPKTTALTITQPSGHCDQFMNALDSGSLAWDIFDPGDQHNSREELLRLTVTSQSGKIARTCYDKENHEDKTITTNRARFLFSMRKVEQFPGFQDKITKAVKKLIVDSGGAEGKELF